VVGIEYVESGVCQPGGGGLVIIGIARNADAQLLPFGV
jgi:hypothetical protein